MKAIKRLYLLPIILGAVFTCAGPFARSEEAAKPAANGNGITLNFRGVPLDTVLDYLSRSAGFVIVKETEVDGNVDVWSHQPLTKDEAVNLLNTILFEKGYAAIRNDRTLTIVRRDDAKQRDIPVVQGNDPQAIPKTDEMVTQIIPVRYSDAMQLIENLQPLLPTYATMSANESSNAIILVDTQKNVRRIAEIIRALDTSISSISAVRVFPLSFADATEIAEVVEEVFQIEDTSSNNRRGGRFQFPGFGGRGGRGGPGGQDDQSSGDSEARKAASRVVAVAEERTNSVVVSAPEELMPMIQNLIADIDIVTDDITEIWVFHLKYADAAEMQQVVTDLFPDDSSTTAQFAPRFGGRGGFPGGPGGMMGGRGGNNTQQNQSERQLQQTSVQAVADPRTNSLVVYAASETMTQIKQTIEQLDSRSDKKQNVYVYKLEYADVENVTTILRNIFENQSTNSNLRSTRNNQNTNANTLSNRSAPTTGGNIGGGN